MSQVCRCKVGVGTLLTILTFGSLTQQLIGLGLCNQSRVFYSGYYYHNCSTPTGGSSKLNYGLLKGCRLSKFKQVEDNRDVSVACDSMHAQTDTADAIINYLLLLGHIQPTLMTASLLKILENLDHYMVTHGVCRPYLIILSWYCLMMIAYLGNTVPT